MRRATIWTGMLTVLLVAGCTSDVDDRECKDVPGHPDPLAPSTGRAYCFESAFAIARGEASGDLVFVQWSERGDFWYPPGALGHGETLGDGRASRWEFGFVDGGQAARVTVLGTEEAARVEVLPLTANALLPLDPGSWDWDTWSGWLADAGLGQKSGAQDERREQTWWNEGKPFLRVVANRTVHEFDLLHGGPGDPPGPRRLALHDAYSLALAVAPAGQHLVTATHRPTASPWYVHDGGGDTKVRLTPPWTGAWDGRLPSWRFTFAGASADDATLVDVLDGEAFTAGRTSAASLEPLDLDLVADTTDLRAFPGDTLALRHGVPCWLEAVQYADVFTARYWDARRGHAMQPCPTAAS